MKKFLLFLSAVFLLTLFSGCVTAQSTEDQSLPETEASTETDIKDPLDNVAYISYSDFEDAIVVYFYNSEPDSYYGYSFKGAKYFLIKYQGQENYLQSKYADLRESDKKIEHLILAFQAGEEFSALEEERLSSCGIDYFFIKIK